MNKPTDIFPVKIFYNPLTLASLYHKKVPDRFTPQRNRWPLHMPVRQFLEVPGCNLSASFIPFIKLSKFYPQKCCLQLIKA
jgi:hypothetical protein